MHEVTSPEAEASETGEAEAPPGVEEMGKTA
jgi:hypothetical protein